MYRVYYFGFNDYGGAGIVVFQPLKNIWASFLTTFTTTTVTKGNHNKTGGNHAYI
jgi:hypothetical protein